jgi:membrane-associated phospholipid phosphatase
MTIIRTSIILLLIVYSVHVVAQKSDSTTVYKVNIWTTGALGIGGLVLSQEMLKKLSDAEPIPYSTIISLDKSQVNKFDRRALKQSNYEFASDAHNISVIMLTASFLLPFTLFIDRKIRKNWLDVTLMYIETQALASNLYIWTGPMLKERYRPITYYEGKVDSDQLALGRNKHSWFSGHVTNTAAGTFFFAKVLTDYHPEWNGKWKIWAAAAIPPAVVGYLRYRALKHFPTDIIAGYLVGAGSGILIPHLHKRKDEKLKMSFYWNEESSGLKARWVLK